MADFWACVIDEIRALGTWCIIRGPEVWLAITAVCIFSAGIVVGLWLGALLGANGRDDDERR